MCCKEFAEALEGDEKHFEIKKRVSVKENKRSFIVHSKGTTDTNCLVRVDKGLIASQFTKKCDFLILRCLEKGVVFVELKGSDVVQGIEQIEETVKYVKRKLGSGRDYVLKSGHVVCSGQPKAQTNVIKARSAFFRKHKFDVHVHTNSYELKF